jgi:undecaprenyl-diphosphatase
MLEADHAIAVFLNQLALSSPLAKSFFQFSAQYLIYSVPIILVLLWFYSSTSKKLALRSFFSGFISLNVGQYLAAGVKRERPFLSGGVTEVMFHRPDYSFPSEHAILLFAVAFSLWFGGYKKLGILMMVLSTIITVSRVAVGFHYPSDVIIGGLLGFAFAWTFWRADRFLDWFYDFWIKVAHKLKLSWSFSSE